ncbi:MAG: hypothetical protein K0S70_406 [Microbacterium sp.]|jgi:PTS system ascorbate-specific IIA component|uniref:Ascorbate-specific PTS system EIIA component n=1 Tax=Microbacterium plantarum TaxID=1816425 RepID=A0ABV5EUJ8_9MICO|nr:PTS sugar transporter subunit IIA [Microbacterium plantarum]MDF2916189.1 hypothetical protein [Microbacterium sp.]WRK16350.1 PTS sugar transporter subunit IIA [Microbacterium plantarum]
MLIEQLSDDRIQFATDLDGWRAAIETVSRPLLGDGSITRSYIDAMIESIAAGGTYIDLGFGIALAHTRPEKGVVRTGLSALWVDPAVLLNDEEAHPITLFFCLAATDTESHLSTMSELARLLSDDRARAVLLSARTTADVRAALMTGVTQ